MVRDYFLEDDGNGNTYYFGSNGAMVTNTWVAIDSSVVDATGDYVPDNYWYYFQSSGKAMKGSTTGLKKATIDGKKYAFNQNGQMSIGWVDDMGDTMSPDNTNPFEGAVYYCGGDNDGALRSGWVTYYDGYADADGGKADYTNLYFYFNPSNNKLVTGETKKINGRTYAFDSNGVMLSGWDVYEDQDLLDNNKVYFSGEDDGHQVKSGWVYAVPAEGISKSAYDDNEEKYMYFGSDGLMKTGDIIKVNGKYYVFDSEGIMKTGIVIWNNSNTTGNKFVATIDTDNAKGSDIAKKGILQYDSDADTTNYMIKVNSAGTVIDTSHAGTHPVNEGNKLKLQYFGDDGARKTGLNSIEFNDDVYALNTSNSGDRGSGEYKKKYYSLGIALKADSDIKYGLFAEASSSKLVAQSTLWDRTLYPGITEDGKTYGYKVLTTSGSLQKGSNAGKKDGNGNYWLIRNNVNTLEGIYTTNVKHGPNSIKSNFQLVLRNNGWTEGYTDQLLQHSSTATTSNASRSAQYTITKISAADMDWLAANAGSLLSGVFARNIADTTGNPEETGLATISWKATVSKPDNNGNRTITFALAEAYSGKAYQTTYNTKSNVWLPYLLKDDDGNYGENYKLEANKLDDSYFLNCYWN